MIKARFVMKNKHLVKILIVSASKDKTFMWLDDLLFLGKNNEKVVLMYKLYENNVQPLTTVYNDALNWSGPYAYDFVMFLHADVKINDLHFFDKIIASKFDLIGVAGATAIDLRKTPLSWYVGVRDAGDRRGMIFHDINGNIQLDVYGPHRLLQSSRCLCIDGVCMVMNRKALDSSIRFDERFTYDFYDMDLSFDATVNHKLSIGIEPLLITHYSIGEGILNDSYKVAEKAFRDKWEVVFNRVNK
jgi:hypothetical protein